MFSNADFQSIKFHTNSSNAQPVVTYEFQSNQPGMLVDDSQREIARQIKNNNYRVTTEEYSTNQSVLINTQRHFNQGMFSEDIMARARGVSASNFANDIGGNLTSASIAKTGGLSQSSYNWLINHLQDKTIKTEVMGIANSGKNIPTYQSMLSIFEGVNSSIRNSALSANQFHDLQTLVSTVGSASGTNSYLYGVSNALVNGNPANAYWTGGASTSSYLGNLQVGSRANQLNELIDKWFLGRDNPTTINNTPGEYVLNTSPLFSKGGPVVADINQGSLGDCYYLAGLAAVAQDQPDLIKSMFTDNGNGTYGVRFYDDNGRPSYITVDQYVDSAGATNDKDKWVQLAEKAYVEFRSESSENSNNYKAIEGGWDNGLISVTGCSTQVFYGQNYDTSSAWEAAVDNPLINALQNHQEVLYASMQEATDVNGRTALVAQHMYSVLGYDNQTDCFVLRNPWGGPEDGSRGYDVKFEVSGRELWGNGGDTAGTIFIDTKQPLTAQNKLNTNQMVQAMAAFSPPSGARTNLAANLNHFDKEPAVLHYARS